MANGGIIGPVNNPKVTTGTVITNFTSPGTFTARTNQTSVDVMLVAGGGGGGSVGGNTAGGGGGGGGGYVDRDWETK